MSDVPSFPNVTNMDFEDALAALEGVVRQLEGGQIRLEEAVAAYERGVSLKRHCETRLKEARAKIERISTDSEVEVGALSSIAGET